MSDVVQTSIEEYGRITFADEVVAIIAGLAAAEIEGVAAMSGGFTGSFTEMLGMKNLSKGVKVEIGETEAAIDLYLVVKYGVKIPEMALKIQENVTKTVETMTGLKVVEVNIHVQGINFDDRDENPEQAMEPQEDARKLQKSKKK